MYYKITKLQRKYGVTGFSKPELRHKNLCKVCTFGLKIPDILWKKKRLKLRKQIKGLCRAKHDTTSACRQGKVEQVYIKSKCGHCILLYTVICWTLYFALHSNMLDSLHFAYLSCFTISSVKYDWLLIALCPAANTSCILYYSTVFKTSQKCNKVIIQG